MQARSEGAVAALLDGGADVAAADPAGATALHLAAGYGRMEVNHPELH